MTRTADFKCKIIILNFPQKSKFKNKNYILKLQNADNNGARCELILLNHMNSKQKDKNKKILKHIIPNVLSLSPIYRNFNLRAHLGHSLLEIVMTLNFEFSSRKYLRLLAFTVKTPFLGKTST